jgi:hypothetical protein
VTLSKSLLVSGIVLQGIINGKRTKMTVVYKTDLEKDFEHVRCSLTMFPHQILINLTVLSYFNRKKKMFVELRSDFVFLF